MKQIGYLGPVLVLAAGCLTACAHVEPWERGNLAKPQMALDHNPILSVSRDHVNSSREGMPSGGAGEGGGCGCY